MKFHEKKNFGIACDYVRSNLNILDGSEEEGKKQTSNLKK